LEISREDRYRSGTNSLNTIDVMSLRSRFARITGRHLLGVSILVTAAIGLAGARHYAVERRTIEADTRHQLETIARLKVDQVAHWRANRLLDARNVARTVRSLAGTAALESTRGRRAQVRELREWLESTRSTSRYVGIAVVEANGRPIVSSIPAALEKSYLPDTGWSPPSSASMRIGVKGNGFLLLSVVAPLDEEGGQTSVVLCINSHREFLEMFHQSSDSRVETLLVWRGPEPMYLTAPVTGNRDLDDAALPAIQAVKGRPIVDGFDYRGDAVLDATAEDAGSSWSVISKMRRQDIEAALRKRSSHTAALFIGLLAAAALLVELWRRNQLLQAHRERERAELERKALVGHLGALSRYANDIILLFDPQGRITEANERAVEAYGYTADELKRLTIRDLRDPADASRLVEQWRAAESQGGIQFETVHIRKDGSRFTVEVSSRAVDVEGHRFRQSIIRDRTEQKRAEQEFQRVHRAMAVLSQSNALVVRATHERKLLSDACRVMIDTGGYRMTWIGAIDEDADLVKPVLAFGEGVEYLNNIQISLSETEFGKGPAGIAFRTRRIAFCRDMENDPSFAPWRIRALEHGFHSGAVLPIVVSGEVLAILGVYAGEANAFDSQEAALLEEVAADLSFGIEVLRQKADLRDSEAKFRTVFDSAGDAIFIHDVNGNFLDVNAAACDRLGYTRDEFLEISIAELDDRRNLNRAPERVERLRLAGRLLFETVHVTKSGQRIPVELNSRMIDFGGSPAVLSVARDIRERLRVESALEKSLTSLNRTQRVASVGIWENEYVYADGADVRVWSEWSDEVFRILGLDRMSARADANRLAVAVHPEDRELVRGALDRAFTEGSSFDIEHRIIHGEEEVRWVRQQGDTVADSQGRTMRMFGTIQDITEYRRLSEQVQQSQKLESIGRLAGGVAHDFNNLLTVINGYAHTILDTIEESHPLREPVSEILQAGTRAADLTKQLLAFSRGRVVERRSADLNRTVLEMRTMLQRMVGEDVEVVMRLAENVGCVQAGANQLQQILMNLAVNARDAMPGGGRLLIETGLAEAGDEPVTADSDPGGTAFSVLSVTDTGLGMDEETRKHIFEPFYTTKMDGVGTGLGLSTVYGIVGQNGGSIAVSSELGKGTVMRICLPQVEAEAECTDQRETVAPLAVQGATVLLVEDQSELRRLAASVLRGQGYRVLEAGSGAEALSLYESCGQTFDLLLSDMVMPGMSGPELAREFSRRSPRAKVLLMSGYSQEPLGVGSDGAVNAYLPKPFSPQALVAKVRDCLVPEPTAILLVDDDDAVRGLLKSVLKQAGYTVLEASNGHQAMSVIERERIELLITDLVMPEQEGLELLRGVRCIRPGLKIVAISGARGGQFLGMARLLGADATLPKPIEPDVFLKAVQGVLAQPCRV
jgi:PAS domain S-box-containing protein